MKRTFGSVFAAILASVVMAQETRPTSRPTHPDLELVRSFEHWAAAHPEAAARLKARMDQNGDGRIDAAEKELALQILRERREEFQKWAQERADTERRRKEKHEQELKAAEAETQTAAARAKDKGDALKERDRQIQRAKERMERAQRERAKAPTGNPSQQK